MREDRQWRGAGVKRFLVILAVRIDNFFGAVKNMGRYLD